MSIAQRRLEPETVIAESREAITQTARMTKLTFLVFIFVPLSLITSFFGINFQELGRSAHTLRILARFLMLAPLLVCVGLSYTFNTFKIWHSLQIYVYSIQNRFPK